MPTLCWVLGSTLKTCFLLLSVDFGSKNPLFPVFIDCSVITSIPFLEPIFCINEGKIFLSFFSSSLFLNGFWGVVTLGSYFAMFMVRGTFTAWGDTSILGLKLESFLMSRGLFFYWSCSCVFCLLIRSTVDWENWSRPFTFGLTVLSMPAENKLSDMLPRQKYLSSRGTILSKSTRGECLTDIEVLWSVLRKRLSFKVSYWRGFLGDMLSKWTRPFLRG